MHASPRVGQMAIDPKTARAGFVDKVQTTVGRAERTHQCVERLEVARDDAVVADFTVALVFRDRHVDRFLVDIQPYRTCYGVP